MRQGVTPRAGLRYRWASVRGWMLTAGDRGKAKKLDGLNCREYRSAHRRTGLFFGWRSSPLAGFVHVVMCSLPIESAVEASLTNAKVLS